jgi:hypothetical protein
MTFGKIEVIMFIRLLVCFYVPLSRCLHTMPHSPQLVNTFLDEFLKLPKIGEKDFYKNPKNPEGSGKTMASCSTLT